MKQITISGLQILIDVSDNFDKQEIQEHLDLMNLHLSRNADASGQIIGVDNIESSDVNLI